LQSNGYEYNNNKSEKRHFNNSKIICPEALKVGGEVTTNFSSPENFVVLECVHNLLEKGYKPGHIELEPKWILGHGASGGRADIFIKNQAEKLPLIIECKTFGKEFTKEWKEMQATFKSQRQQKNLRRRPKTQKFSGC
jgi:hypothetical protein